VQASSPTLATPAETTALADSLFHLLRRLLLDPDADHLRAVEERDLTLSQVRALMLIACSDPEPLPGGRIAERLGISPAAISRALDGLVRQELLERRESEHDRRVRLLAVTPAGRALADELRALRRNQIEGFVSNLEPEQATGLAAAIAALELEPESA
jgi:DNA-binding MarR family transcriptional regulator